MTFQCARYGMSSPPICGLVRPRLWSYSLGMVGAYTQQWDIYKLLLMLRFYGDININC